ncbi:DNA mismatch repair protein MSH2 [Nematocida sp. LUAm3]|nr:DNA mismatch repair protein MSH2 [Nematocida sp. LUAm3]KAI5175999.1 DNA mismatch repair protein MSH2 [Nematocida sp. LUAm2]KAI5179095.1 DNA mismatch repair protein MSH2 [Nematocida sp. LUAm1]
METIKIKRKGDFFLVHKETEESARKILGERGEDEVRIPGEKIGHFISKIVLENNCTIEEYVDLGEKEVLVRKASPGNWSDFSEYLVGDKETSKISSVIIEKEKGNIIINILVICTIEKALVYYEFSDSEIYTNLASFLYEKNIKEAIYEDISLKKVFTAMDIPSHQIKKQDKRKSKEERLVDLVESFLNIKTSSYTKKEESLASIMKMDKSVGELLLNGDINIWKEINCITPQGKRTFDLFLRTPSTDISEIKRRQNIVEEIVPICEMLKETVKHFPDILIICKKTKNSSISLREVLKIYKVIKESMTLLSKTEHIESFYLENSILKESLSQVEEILRIIEKRVNIPQEEINPNYSAELSELYSRKHQLEREVAVHFSSHAEILKRVKPKLERTPQLGYYIKGSRSEFNGNLEKDFITISAQKSGICFTTKDIKIYNSYLFTLEKEIEEKIASIIKEMQSEISLYIEWMEMINYTVGIIDCFASISHYGKLNNWKKPIFSSEMYKVKAAYHPLLPSIYRAQKRLGRSPPEITKNDLHLEEKRFCIVTGPNMGGKTTFLKTIAMISVLAQIGSFVPAEHVEIPIFHSLFLRIGASDSPEKNISTFMMEMQDISKILNQADTHSLVIIDELGRGTSEEDGYSIAQAVIEYIINKNAFTLFSTHFYDLCKLPNITNKKVSTIQVDDKILMSYKIEDGVADSSYGIRLIDTMNFPKEVVETANFFNQKNI